MSSDKVCKIMNSYVQHGSHNDRVYLMKLSENDYPAIVSEIDRLCVDKGYSKSFAKVPSEFQDEFLNSGYLVEGLIPGLFHGDSDGYFLCKYYNEKRKRTDRGIITETTLRENSLKKSDYTSEKGKFIVLPDEYILREAEYSDSEALSNLFSEVFESYPFPVNDPSYIKKTMDEGIFYFGIWKDEKLIAAASSETDIKSLSVEMTDFASQKNYRGFGFAGTLLDKMEDIMRDRGFITAYTIARAAFLPVNRLFFRKNYKYAGTLINNTNICGSFESMNIWYKKL